MIRLTTITRIMPIRGRLDSVGLNADLYIAGA
jgi:hypothetical protein